MTDVTQQQRKTLEVTPSFRMGNEHNKIIRALALNFMAEAK
jgi:hypothetical protein